MALAITIPAPTEVEEQALRLHASALDAVNAVNLFVGELERSYQEVGDA